MQVSKIRGYKPGEAETVLPETPIQAAAERLAERRIGLLVVCAADRRIAGVFSERDLVRAVAAHGAAALARPVADAMTRDVQVCRPSDSLESVMAAMTAGHFRHMPVVENGKLAYMISSTDILHYLNRHASSEEKTLFWSKVVWV